MTKRLENKNTIEKIFCLRWVNGQYGRRLTPDELKDRWNLYREQRRQLNQIIQSVQHMPEALELIIDYLTNVNNEIVAVTLMLLKLNKRIGFVGKRKIFFSFLNTESLSLALFFLTKKLLKNRKNCQFFSRNTIITQ